MRLGWAAAVLAAWAMALTTAAAAEGAALFKQHCAACHQESGAGTVGLAPPLLGEPWQKLGAERSYLPTVVLKGLSGPIKTAAGPFNGSMPAFAASLNDDEAAAVANHLRSLQGAADFKPYAADELAALRATAGNPAITRALRRKVLGE